MVRAPARRLDEARRSPWKTAAELTRVVHARAGLSGDKLSILNAVWDKELGHLSGHWGLAGVKGGVLFVKPSSSAAAQELQLRSPEIARRLNKYFNKPWIKSVKAATR